MAYLTTEEREERNKVYRKYGYYWSKPRRTDSWALLNRNGRPISNPDALWMDIQANPEKYERERAQVRVAAIHLAQHLIEQDALIVDCETSGSGGAYEEVIELAILKLDGSTLFYSLIRCNAPIHPDATALHGITNEQLSQAPAFPEVWQTVAPLIREKSVAMFNADFDRRILAEEAEHYKLVVPIYRPRDLMRMYMAIVPEGRYRLQEACEHFGIAAPGHHGVEDAEATRQVLLAMARVE